jgi:hypothetical protein
LTNAMVLDKEVVGFISWKALKRNLGKEDDL